MNRWRKLLLFFWGMASSLGYPIFAEASVTCVQVHIAKQDPQSLGFSPSDVEALVSKVAQAIGLTPSGIMVVPCSGIGKVLTKYYDRKDIPRGEYIFYDPAWVREVVGTTLSNSNARREHDEAVVLFGHELGHLIDRHFTTNADLPRIVKETNADRFAGCAAAGLLVKWDRVKDFLSRIRGDIDTDYPSREHSIAAAKLGYDACRRSINAPSDEIARKILGTEKSFCSDIMAVAADAGNDFEGLRGEAASDGKTWDANRNLAGFRACRITKGDYFNFTCQTDMANSLKSGKLLHQKLSSRVKSCLNQSWAYSAMDDKTGFFNNFGTSRTIILSLYHSLALDDTEKYYGNIVVYDMSRKLETEDEAKIEHKNPSKPSSYCEDLKKYIESGKTGFSNLVRSKQPKNNFFGVRRQLNNWNGCDIGSLAEDGSNKYLTCKLGPFDSRENTGKMLTEIQPDIASCLGDDWSAALKMRTDGTARVEFSAFDNLPTVELRTRESVDGTWEIKLDIESVYPN